MKRCSVRLYVCALSCAFAACTFAQSPKIEPLGWLDPGLRHSVARGVSSDGVYVCGHSVSPSGFTRAFIWSEADGIQEIGTHGGVSGDSYAEGVSSADGGIVAGHSASPFGFTTMFRWSPATGMQQLRDHFLVDSYAYDVSPNGTYIAGAEQYDPPMFFPTWWISTTNWGALGQNPGLAMGINDDGELAGHANYQNSNPPRWRALTPTGFAAYHGAASTAQSYAKAISADGSKVVGHELSAGTSTAMLWQNRDTAIPLETPSGTHSYAYDISPDADLIVGEVAEGQAARGEAYVWYEGNDHTPKKLWDFLVDEYGVDMTGWTKLHSAKSCSDGDWFGYYIVGHGEYEGATTAYRVTLPLKMRRPIFETWSPIQAGQTYTVPLGQTFNQWLAGRDMGGYALTIGYDGLPPSAVVDPPAGITNPSKLINIVLTPTLADVGTHEVTVTIANAAYIDNPTSLTFYLEVPPNNEPTASSPAPQTVQCVDGTHHVELSTTVDDADGHPLTVTWKVNGTVEQTTPNVAPDSTVDFGFDFPHGENSVVVEVFDGYHVRSASTTITVEDATSPTVIVAEDVVVATDPGKGFATGVALTLPTVTDNCDGEPALFHDAPSEFPLGDTIVIWTATDADGNHATGTQKVTVIDGEPPQIAPAPDMQFFCDEGEVYSTANLTPPDVTDNVPVGLTVASDAPEQLPLGETVVNWKATDAAGNASAWSQTVKVVNRRPRANAGKTIKIATKSERGATVRLDGSASTDPDRHELTFSWSAKSVRLKKAKSATPSGRFPIGTTNVKLTVTDEAGASHSKNLRVVVRLRNANRRSRGKLANDATANAAFHSTRDAASGMVHGHSLSGLVYANAAYRTSVRAGDHVVRSDDQDPAQATFDYLELRAAQREYARAAAAAHLSAYADTGEIDALYAAAYAYAGVRYAAADLIEP